MKTIKLAWFVDGFGLGGPTENNPLGPRDERVLQEIYEILNNLEIDFEDLGYIIPDQIQNRPIDLFIMDYGALIDTRFHPSRSGFAKDLIQFAEDRPSSILFITSEIGETFLDSEREFKQLNEIKNVVTCYTNNQILEQTFRLYFGTSDRKLNLGEVESL